MSKEIAIVIPIYKTSLNTFENIALTQLFNVLYKYDIYIACPSDLDLRGSIFDKFFFKIQYFDRKFFDSIKGYNKLCMDISFYERFSSYSYILIYQTDAFIFSDKLMEFVYKGYDYIGAPEDYYIWDALGIDVGNGGLSLRKIDTFITLLEKKNEIFASLESVKSKEISLMAKSIEDIFFSYALKYFNCKVPAADFAVWFSVEDKIWDFLDKHPGERPFGCHRWYAQNFEIWWPLIEKYGFSADKSSIKNYAGFGSEYQRRIINQQILQGRLNEIVTADLSKISSKGKTRIYGFGVVGKRCIEVMVRLGIEIEAIFDRKKIEGCIYPTK